MPDHSTDHDVLDVLTTDHREVSELFEIGGAVDPAERRDLSDSLISELVRHSVAADPGRTEGKGRDGEEDRAHASALRFADAELFHKLVGPGVGLVDRLRDRLTGRST